MRVKQYPKAVRNAVFKLRRQGLTYKQVAKKIGISVPTVSLWVRAEADRGPRIAKSLFARPR